MPVHAFPSPLPQDPERGPPLAGASLDSATLAFYEAHAADYAERISRSAPDGDLKTFMEALPATRDPVHDWGCGPGNTAALLAEAGIACEASDASPAMAGLAAELGVAARVQPFEALDSAPRLRGVWANFSLIHAPRAMFAPLVARAAAALVPGGVLHLGQDISIGHPCGETGREVRYFGVRYTLIPPDDIMAAVRGAGLLPVSARSGSSRCLHGTPLEFHILLARKPL